MTSDKLSGRDSNALLFIGAGLYNSSVELKKTDSGDDNDEAKNEGGQVEKI